MCGIVGYVGTRECARLLLEGLSRLEYRGYDSAGLAIHDGKDVRVLRAVGKLANLDAALGKSPLSGTTGIGHTRWATHGRPSEANAHPHVAGGVAVVHNGIIENHVALRRQIEERGVKLASDTDTEIVAHLIHLATKDGASLEDATRRALRQVRGTYAIAVLAQGDPSTLVVAKNASPLVVGLGDGETWAGSDVPALLSWTREMMFLDDGDVAVITAKGARVTTLDGAEVKREVRHIDWSPMMAEKAGFKHFMLKEIHEQPRAIEDTLRGRLDREAGDVDGAELGLGAIDVTQIDRVVLLACGTSHHAAIAGRYWLESLAKVPTTVELASEFRNRAPVVSARDLVVAVSQSGETLDTLMAVKEAKAKGAKILAVANVIGSAIPRLADGALYTHAGPEIGVASTKCFTTQLAALLMLAVHVGRRRGTLEAKRARELVEGLAKLPHQMRDVITGTRQLVASLARRYGEARDVLFLGRGTSFPIALEGALKLKEISYVHAEGYAAGEMKHGPIALIDASVPVFVVLPKDEQYEKTLGNLHEVKAREGKVIAIVSEDDAEAAKLADEHVEVPAALPELTPLLTVLPLQLYAYYVADHKGTDVDQPRNLAKTVTVE